MLEKYKGKQLNSVQGLYRDIRRKITGRSSNNTGDAKIDGGHI